jgi:hypothetical protein
MNVLFDLVVMDADVTIPADAGDGGGAGGDGDGVDMLAFFTDPCMKPFIEYYEHDRRGDIPSSWFNCVYERVKVLAMQRHVYCTLSKADTTYIKRGRSAEVRLHAGRSIAVRYPYEFTEKRSLVLSYIYARQLVFALRDTPELMQYIALPICVVLAPECPCLAAFGYTPLECTLYAAGIKVLPHRPTLDVAMAHMRAFLRATQLLWERGLVHTDAHGQNIMLTRDLMPVWIDIDAFRAEDSYKYDMVFHGLMHQLHRMVNVQYARVPAEADFVRAVTPAETTSTPWVWKLQF